MTWLLSAAAVMVSGVLAWLEGSWKRRPGLDMGFVNHGGMWGDLILLPIANAVIVPQWISGGWLLPALLLCSGASCWVHHHWYRGSSPAHSRDHMWPSRPYGVWWRDLSWAGWAHVPYVAGELSILVGFLLLPMPTPVVAVVTLVLTLHLPLGLLQPRWFLTRRLGGPRQQPLLVPCLVFVWITALVKL